jgi:proteasome accessory factor C
VPHAVDRGERLAITYYSASTDQTAERTITPRHLFASEGHWYVDAWCEVADGVRRFRVDRIASATPAGPAAPEVLADELPVPGARAAGGVGPTALGAFVPGPDSRRVRVVADRSMAWLLETIPSVALADDSGARPVWEVFVGGDAWLERLLLRLGPDAEVLDPVEDRALAPDAAARILARYGAAPA